MHGRGQDWFEERDSLCVYLCGPSDLHKILVNTRVGQWIPLQMVTEKMGGQSRANVGRYKCPCEQLSLRRRWLCFGVSQCMPIMLHD